MVGPPRKIFRSFNQMHLYSALFKWIGCFERENLKFFMSCIINELKNWTFCPKVGPALTLIACRWIELIKLNLFFHVTNKISRAMNQNLREMLIFGGAMLFWTSRTKILMKIKYSWRHYSISNVKICNLWGLWHRY